jgi:hypothetical protein
MPRGLRPRPPQVMGKLAEVQVDLLAQVRTGQSGMNIKD